MDSSNELAYLAGVFDGEGSFGIWSRGKDKKKGFRASIEMTDADVIMKFLVYFQVGQILFIKPKEKHYKPIYRWKVDLDRAIEVVRKMLPYLSKRRQIQFHETVGKYENRS
tara:strand:+ start:204 stop:536 length:333 start_codon:yes stop_codon:yes gene_type:complete